MYKRLCEGKTIFKVLVALMLGVKNVEQLVIFISL